MLAKRRHGWIGVDIGDGAIKVAQLQRVRDRLQLASAAVVPCPENESIPLAENLRSIRTVATRLRGEGAAAVLSMRHCQVDVTDEETPIEPDQCADAWEADQGASYTLRTPLAQVETAVEGLASARLQCEVIDGMPLAIARALRFSPGYERGALLGALDLGESNATFVAATDGRARYVRRLAIEGFGSIRRQIAEALALSGVETTTAVQRYGVVGSDAAPEAKLVSEAIRQAIRPTVQELRRTFSHLGGRLKSKPPERLLLMGMGATVPGLPEAIGEQLGATGEAWQAAGVERTTDGSTPDGLLGPAIALSALGWEVR